MDFSIASLTAATTRSCSISGSLAASGSIRTETSFWFPVATTVTAPPPALRAASPLGGEVTSPPTTVQSVSGWSEVLEKLNRTVRAAYLDAQPEVDGSVLVLWFRYGFHHKKAQEQSAQLIPHVRAWLGDEVKIDFRLRENDAAKSVPRPASPEDDPFVREIVRRFDGRVTRVKEVSE